MLIFMTVLLFLVFIVQFVFSGRVLYFFSFKHSL